MTASGSSRPGCHSKSAFLSKKRDVKPVGASSAARLRLKGPAPTPTASNVKSASMDLRAFPTQRYNSLRPAADTLLVGVWSVVQSTYGPLYRLDRRHATPTAAI